MNYIGMSESKRKTIKLPRKIGKIKIKKKKIETIKSNKIRLVLNKKTRKKLKKLKLKSKQKKSMNQPFIDILTRLENIMKMKGEPFRARAYQKAKETIMAFPDNITSAEQIRGLPGIGETILKKFREFQETGTLKAFEKEKNHPRYIFAEVYGIGPKKAKQLADMGLTSIAELRERQDELLNDVQKKGLLYYEDILKRIPRSEIVDYEKAFKRAFDKVKQDGDEFEILGSYRRGAKTSGDIDVAITNRGGDKSIFNKFIEQLQKDGVVIELLSKGATKSLTVGKLANYPTARRLDFMYSKPDEYAFALLYFTGSMAFNVVQRRRAIELGYTMNEHGLYKLTGTKKKTKGARLNQPFPDEKSIFDFLGLVYKSPTERKSGRDVILKTAVPVAEPTPQGETKTSLKKGTKKKALKIRVPKTLKNKKFKVKSIKNADLKKKWKRLQKEGISVVSSFSENHIAAMVRLACDAYYNNQPFISDNVFDILKEYGQVTFPNNPCFDEVGAPTDKKKVKLPFQMHSMDKIKPDTNALPKYLKKYPGPKVISAKLDGISVLFSGGKLYTRGKATHGMDISYMIPYLELPSRKDVTLRGELLIREALFNQKYSAAYKNSRNMVAGVVNSKKRESEKWADLDFVAYEVIVPEMKPSDQMSWLQENNVVTVLNQTVDEISNDLLSELLVEWRSNYEYTIDGIIVNDDKIHPRRNKNPDHAFAFKMVLGDQVAEVKVLDVIYTASKDGYLNPVVRVEPVDIRGVTIEFATANNAKFIKDNNIGVGAIIQLVRSGDVIPKIEAVIQPADEPMMPNVPWKWNETKVDAVLESMENNPMVLQKTIEFFFKKLDIKGVGPGNVKKMINAGFNTVPKILKATREELLTVDGFKDKTVEKIRTNIDNVIVNSSLVMIASATNIFGRGLGSSIIRNILHEYPNILESGESDETKINQIAQVENIGKKRAAKFIKNIPTFLSFLQEANLTQKLSEQLGQNVDPNHPLFEKRIVMTGFRDKPLKTALTELGAKIGSSVSQNTFVVLVNDEDEETSKTEEAKEKGIPIMLVDNFRKKYNL
jgi:NAD-dependent DNA ligase